MKKFPFKVKVEVKKNDKQEIIKESKIVLLVLLVIGVILWIHSI